MFLLTSQELDCHLLITNLLVECIDAVVLVTGDEVTYYYCRYLPGILHFYYTFLLMFVTSIHVFLNDGSYSVDFD